MTTGLKERSGGAGAAPLEQRQGVGSNGRDF